MVSAAGPLHLDETRSKQRCTLARIGDGKVAHAILYGTVRRVHPSVNVEWPSGGARNVHSVAVYYLCLLVLVLAMAAAWFATLFALPGNWLIVGLAALFAVFYPAGEGHGLRWSAVGIGAVLAIIGEAIELLAGAAGARRAGASRRSAVYALAGTIVGSILGATVSIPIPIVGPIIGALGGGALGAFAGAFVGETAIGKDVPQSVAAGKGALVGRLVGAVGKLAVGAVMIVIIVIGALV